MIRQRYSMISLRKECYFVREEGISFSQESHFWQPELLSQANEGDWAKLINIMNFLKATMGDASMSADDT